MNIFRPFHVIRFILLTLWILFVATQAKAQTAWFTEGFGGGDAVSTSASNDWWITVAESAGLQARYGSEYGYADHYEWNDTTNQRPDAYKGMAESLSLWAGCFAIAKKTDFLRRPDYIRSIDSDHTYSGDGTKGYFFFIDPRGDEGTNPSKVIYQYTEKSFSRLTSNQVFSVWLANLHKDGGTTYLTLQVTGGTGFGDPITRDITLTSTDWTNYQLPFKVPEGYTGAITISVLRGANNNWNSLFGMDDISISDFDASVTITGPASGSKYCQWEWVVLKADYVVLESNSIWIAQYREQGEGEWIDLGNYPDEEPFGTLKTTSGTIEKGISFNKSADYRILIAESTDESFLNPITSNSVYLSFEDKSKTDILTITQNKSAIRNEDVDGIELEASTSAFVSDLTIKWREGNSEQTEQTGSTYTVPPFWNNLPVSGIVSTKDKYSLTARYDNLCESDRIDVPVEAYNYRTFEDFKSGDGDFLFSEDGVKYTYKITDKITDYGYAADRGMGTNGADAPVMIQKRFLFTKKIYQHTWSDGSTHWDETVTDHTGNGGYFLQIEPGDINPEDPPVIFYETRGEVCAGSKFSFTAWVINLSKDTSNKLQFKFRVAFLDADGDEVVQKSFTTDVLYGYSSDWKEHGFSFFVPNDSRIETAVFTLESESSNNGVWKNMTGFALDDIKIERLAPAQIITPESLVVKVIKGAKAILQGIYACGAYFGGTNDFTSIVWQKRVESSDTWIDVITGATTIAPVIDNDEVVYYRLKAEAGKTFTSDEVKIIPVSVEDLVKTYWVCPDNMTDDEAKKEERYNFQKKVFLPGMVSLGEPGYLPSVIRMELEELYGITYKWYTDEDVLIPDGDEYDPDQYFSSTGDEDNPRPLDDIADPILLSDGKSNTLSVMNERSTEGVFIDRTYWVEFCDMQGNAIDGMDRIPIYLKQPFLCGSLDAKISPVTARRLSRANFGGTEADADAIRQTPLDGIDYQWSNHPIDVIEGGYQVSKVSPPLSNNGWYQITDHIYENIANETHGYLLSVNATEYPGVFYTREMANLNACSDISLTFTGWFASAVVAYGNEKANLKYVLTDNDPVDPKVLSEFTTGNMIDKEGKWRQFGFKFDIPDGVTSIKFQVINNNFGTAFGNDVFLDDIEIYMSMPPIKLSPSENSLVCPNSSRVSLKGEYTDDGTLKDNLDYRWEYRKTEDDEWVPIGGASGSVENGIVTPDISEYIIEAFTTDNDGYYRLVIGQSGAFVGTPNYDCMALSEPRRLTLATGEDAPILRPALAGHTARCYEDEILEITVTEKSTSIKDYDKYTWILDGEYINNPDVDEDSEKIKIQIQLANLAPGYHTLTFTAFNAADCAESVIHEFLIFPKTTTWIAGGDFNNWNDSRNWSNGVPGECTNVIIPNKSMDPDATVLLDHYPLLSYPTVEDLNGNEYADNQKNLENHRIRSASIYLRAACDTILFKMNGAVARTDYLNYSFASVDLDIQPKRWYMVSAPLRSMYSGDYFVENSEKRRNPSVYMMKYNAKNPQTDYFPVKNSGEFTHSFNTLTEEMYPGLGFVVWVDDTPATDKELQPFRFPKDSTEYAMWTYNGDYIKTVTIPERTHIGRFTYESRITMKDNLPDPGTGSTEFTVEVKEDKSGYTTVMVGNPFMAHLDYKEFKDKNNAISDGGYYVWHETSFAALNPATMSEDPNEIPPMQSFIVGKTGELKQLTFTTGMAIKAPLPNANGALLRSSISSVESKALRIDVLRNSLTHSHIRLKYVPTEKNTYEARKDMWTLFSANVKEPAVLYALLDGKAASIRTLGDLSESIELGIRTTEKGLLTLRLSGMETLDDYYYLYLEDRLLNVVHDLKENPEYTFSNETGNVEGRLFLRILEEPLAIDSATKDSGIVLRQENTMLRIETPVNDPIRMVAIYSVQGKLLYSNKIVGIHTCRVELPPDEQIVVVSVITEHAWRNEKIRVQ